MRTTVIQNIINAVNENTVTMKKWNWEVQYNHGTRDIFHNGKLLMAIYSNGHSELFDADNFAPSERPKVLAFVSTAKPGLDGNSPLMKRIRGQA